VVDMSDYCKIADMRLGHEAYYTASRD